MGVPTSRYLKTTDLASVAHVSKYLSVRRALESRGTDSEVDVQLTEDEPGWQFKIHVVEGGGKTAVSVLGFHIVGVMWELFLLCRRCRTE